MGFDNNTKAFLALVRAGLWEEEVRLSEFEGIDLKVLYRLAKEQSVVGLVAAGLEQVKSVLFPKEDVLTIVGDALQIEQRNQAMNHFIGFTVEKMRFADIYILLVKGQGIAQCYKKPLWRECGDIDFLLSPDNYNKAKVFLLSQASSVEDEGHKALHFGMTIDTWEVELHGTLRSCILKRMDKIIDEVQADVFFGGNVRSWCNNNVQIFLPSYDNDVFFVFTHILKHFFRGGIGLRQICDWCRLLWTCREKLNIPLLESRIKRAGIMTEWKSFAAYAVDYLGMPIDAMPLYSHNKRWNNKARRINDNVLRVGNLGHNRIDISHESKYLTRKIKAFKFRFSDFFYHLSIFPLDAFIVFGWTVFHGITSFIKGK